MNCWPIVLRELRSESRRRFNYGLRTLVAVTIVLLYLLPIVALGATSRPTGNALFADLNWTVFLAIWAIVPFLTGDCLSREKREGTLGLLLLTPLRPLDIVLGKCVVHALRAITALLAVLPVTAIIFLVGGVTGPQVLVAVAVLGGAVLMALAAGLLASALVKRWNASLIATALCAVVFGQVYYQFSRGPMFATRAGLGLVLSLIIFALTAWLAAFCIQRTWQDRPRSARQIWWIQLFCAPRFWRHVFRRLMRRQLERNPIGWLHHYSTGSRLTKWLWCLLAAPAVSLSFGNTGSSLLFQFELLLAVVIAFTAASSFYRERRNRMLELILVSPLTEHEILWGRIRGLCSQFVPPFLLVQIPLLLFQIIVGAVYSRPSLHAWFVQHLMLTGVWFASLMTAGVYFAVRSKTLALAWGVTFLFGVLIPMAIMGPATLRFGLFGAVGNGRAQFMFLYTLVLFISTSSELAVNVGKPTSLLRETPERASLRHRRPEKLALAPEQRSDG